MKEKFDIDCVDSAIGKTFAYKRSKEFLITKNYVFKTFQFCYRITKAEIIFFYNCRRIH